MPVHPLFTGFRLSRAPVLALAFLLLAMAWLLAGSVAAATIAGAGTVPVAAAPGDATAPPPCGQAGCADDDGVGAEDLFPSSPAGIASLRHGRQRITITGFGGRYPSPRAYLGQAPPPRA